MNEQLKLALEAMGYSFHVGETNDDLHGLHWWCWKGDSPTDIVVQDDECITLEETVEDAKDDAIARFEDDARNYFGLDPSFQFTGELLWEHIVDMFEQEQRLTAAQDACRLLLLGRRAEAIDRARTAFTQQELERIEADAAAANARAS
jgi:3-methyladenine DNA glycosylase/8-oxoguanine DNA glycosylase